MAAQVCCQSATIYWGKKSAQLVSPHRSPAAPSSIRCPSLPLPLPPKCFTFIFSIYTLCFSCARCAPASTAYPIFISFINSPIAISLICCILFGSRSIRLDGWRCRRFCCRRRHRFRPLSTEQNFYPTLTTDRSMRDGHSQFIRRKLFPPPRFCLFFSVRARACFCCAHNWPGSFAPVLSLIAIIQELAGTGDKHL